jgi:hypothetical protein
MARISSDLHRIGAVESYMCDCGQAAETMEHFLFLVYEMRCATTRHATSRISNGFSFFLGGKGGAGWTPDGHPPTLPNPTGRGGAVRAAIRFTHGHEET